MTDSPARHIHRPRRLIAVCGLVGVAFLALPVMRGRSPAVSQVPPLLFDTFFGVGGFIIMGSACVWLWRRGQRDKRALAGTIAALVGVIALITLRLIGFVHADYDRGRLPFAVGVALMSAVVAYGLWVITRPKA